MPRSTTPAAPRPYVESDPTGPRSVYGETKLEGERQVLAASARHTVVRTAWLFGLDGRNFVDTMLRLAGEREAVQVVTDQIGSPTWSGHLAPALLGLLERDVRGLVHLTGAGAVSWNGFAEEIFRQAEVDCRVEPASSAQMARPAPRPAWSVLESEREDVLPMPPWQDGLAGYLAAQEWDDARMKLLVCGGAGFIGSTFARLRVSEHGDEVTVLDKLTYAGPRGEPARGRRGARAFASSAARSRTPRRSRRAIEAGRPEAIVNFAAETHVDRSIAEPDAFVKTHALGTYVLLEAARAARAALRAGLDRRGVRLDRGGHVHGGEPAAPVLARTRRRRRAPTCSCRATSTPTACPR